MSNNLVVEMYLWLELLVEIYKENSFYGSLLRPVNFSNILSIWTWVTLSYPSIFNILKIDSKWINGKIFYTTNVSQQSCLHKYNSR